MKKYKLLLIAGFTLGLSCTKEESDPTPPTPEPDPCAQVNATFSADIFPIFQASCALSGCHDEYAQEGDKIFDTYENIKASIQGDEEQFLRSINFEGGSTGWMPRENVEENASPDNKLPESQIMQIECWIAQGMPED